MTRLLNPTKPDRNKILILGGVIHENRGDLAMIEGLLRQLEREHPDLIAVFFCHNPALFRAKFPVLCLESPDLDLAQGWSRTTSRFAAIIGIAKFLISFLAFRYLPPCLVTTRIKSASLNYFNHLYEARAVIIPGSGSFNSLWWYDWIYPKAACCAAASLAGVPVLVTSQGFGPIEHPLDRIVSRFLFRLAGFLGVRDGDYSKRLLLSLGAEEQKINHTFDDSLLVPLPPEESIESTMLRLGIPKGRSLIGVNLRDAQAYHSDFQGPAFSLLANALDSIVNALDAHIVFVPISYDHYDDDRESARSVADLMISKSYTIICDELPAEMLRGVVTRMTLCLGTSYHFLLFSLNSVVVTIGLYSNRYYEQKLKGLFALFDLSENCFDIRVLTESMLSSRALDALRNRESSLSPQKEKTEQLELEGIDSWKRLSLVLKAECEK